VDTDVCGIFDEVWGVDVLKKLAVVIGTVELGFFVKPGQTSQQPITSKTILCTEFDFISRILSIIHLASRSRLSGKYIFPLSLGRKSMISPFSFDLNGM
jgi:hypothetical protein